MELCLQILMSFVKRPSNTMEKTELIVPFGENNGTSWRKMLLEELHLANKSLTERLFLNKYGSRKAQWGV